MRCINGSSTIPGNIGSVARAVGCVEDGQDQDGFTQIILSTIAKKKLFFPDEIRLVEDFEIVDTKNYFSVNVASRLPL